MFNWINGTLLLLLMCAMFFFANEMAAQNLNPNYDSTLAHKLGADDYGMKQYVFVILKTGSAAIEDKVVRDSLFAGHFSNIKKLADNGKLLVAGPIFKNEKAYRGLFILNVKSFDEANELLANDPTIREKIFDVELYNWYGSAALGEYLSIHEKIWKNEP